MPTFVTFHASLNPQVQTDFQTRGVHLRSHTLYEMQINWMFRSAQAKYPLCRKVIITDQETRFDAAIYEHVDGEIEIFRAQAPGSGAMLSRAQAQVEWLEHEAADGTPQDQPILMLDSDMLINGALEELCSSDYDIALTYRKDPRMPINGGAFFIAPGQRIHALHFSRWVEAIYRDKFPGDLWYGHQLALIEAVGRDAYEKSDKTALAVSPPLSLSQNGAPVRLKLLSVAKWNRTADLELGALNALHGARILHFKGARKKLMQAYFSGFVAPNPSFRWRVAFYLIGAAQRLGKALVKRGKRLRRSFLKRRGPLSNRTGPG